MTEALRYRAESVDGLIETPLDALTSLYHRPSGATHLVGEPLSQILDALRDIALSVADLLAKLGQQQEVVADGDALSALQSHIDALMSIGLVRVE